MIEDLQCAVIVSHSFLTNSWASCFWSSQSWFYC